MLDAQTNAKLRQQFNPDGSKLRSIQMRMLEMLKALDGICRKNGIDYWLASGTCLGAVRHQGFIPWDDDCDIEMTAADYKRLVRIINSDPGSPFVVQNHQSDNGYYHPFGKLKYKNGTEREKDRKPYDRHYRYFGLFIDIFPIVKSNSIKLHHLAFFFHRVQASAWRITNPLLKKIYDNSVGAFTRRLVFPLLEAVGSIGANGRLRCKGGCVYDSSRFEHNIFPTREISFEGVMLKVPNDCHAYLTALYGDYLKLPPLDSINAQGCHFN